MPDPLSAGKGSRSRQPGQQKLPLSGGFPGQLVSTRLVTDVSEDDARRRRASRVPQMCPECVRVFSGQTTTKCRFTGTLCKPSDGLEPSTPSLPWRFIGVTRVHMRSRATPFFLQIRLIWPLWICRETSRGVVSDVSVLCPRVVVCFGNPAVVRRDDATSSVTGRSLCNDVGRRVTPISLVSGSFRVCCFAFRMVAGAVVSAFWATSGPANGASNWAVSNTDG